MKHFETITKKKGGQKKFITSCTPSLGHFAQWRLALLRECSNSKSEQCLEAVQNGFSVTFCRDRTFSFGFIYLHFLSFLAKSTVYHDKRQTKRGKGLKMKQPSLDKLRPSRVWVNMVHNKLIQTFCSPPKSPKVQFQVCKCLHSLLSNFSCLPVVQNCQIATVTQTLDSGYVSILSLQHFSPIQQ